MAITFLKIILLQAMTRKSHFSFSHPYDIHCYMRRLTQWEMRHSLITSWEYEKGTFLPLSGLALVITLIIIYFWGKKKQPHLTRHCRKAKFSSKTSLLRLIKLDLISRHFPICFKGRKKLSHSTHCHRVKFHRKRSTSRNKPKYVVKYSIHHVLLFETTISESTFVWTQRLSDYISKAHHFDRYCRSQFLLLLSGDVELNPGPYTGKYYVYVQHSIANRKKFQECSGHDNFQYSMCLVSDFSSTRHFSFVYNNDIITTTSI